MPNHWQSTTLGEIADYLNGFPFKPGHLSGNALPVIRIRQLVDAAEVPDRTDLEVPDKHHIDDGDIVFSWSATLAVRMWDRGPALLNQHLFKVVPSPGVESRWLALALEHSIEDLAAKSHGTTMKHITKKSLSAHAVRVPPPAEQRRIVDLVGSIDAYIDELEAQVDTTRTARMGVLSDLLSNPGDGWQATTVAEACDILDRQRRPVSSAERAKRPGNVPYYGATGIAGWIDEPIFDEPLVLLGEDAVDFASPTARKAYSIDGPSWVNNHAHVLRPKAIFINCLMLELLLNAVDYTNYAVFGTRSKLTQASMKSIRLSVPLLDEQRRTVDLVESIDEQISSLESQVAAARDMRSGVLSDLLSGERLLTDDYEAAVGL